ncbi:hypothetical protein BAUCODRAFT_79701 [Baudoinia panamericana UAMH 10762]|uniref:Replication protein A C-terminal domain-containing protein n=1 Tax=Baudoinia panamericana (strain UAMH 10762) TaxID=717646 RepID=M2MK38_BAUPA|nr:uncharacterized protein BAUCODRAFT_79701 [Baudoinia panamericana UAMH 10762]EMC91693.1 hypothetical protein BAUCODRAFT_79701 [Baudoinia panamericana UAMH 10762]
MPGSQSNDSPNSKRSYGKDTLRPVTIKQLQDATHPHPDAEYFIIDGAEATQVTFVGQIRNISTQTTNVTYRMDDGTGTMEVKVWIDAEEFNGEENQAVAKPKPVEQGYARVWGRLKAFNNKRHVGANIIRPLQDFNEIQYHLLEATAVHLFFTRGPPESATAQQSKTGGAQANGMANGHAAVGGEGLPAGTSQATKKVYQLISTLPQGHEGVHVQQIAMAGNMEVSEVLKATDDLNGMGKIYSTVNEETFALLSF